MSIYPYLRGDLRVSATRQIEKDVEEKGYHKRERSCSRFERTIKLPVAVKSEEAKANLADGVLKISLPKEVVTSRKRITIDGPLLMEKVIVADRSFPLEEEMVQLIPLGL